MADLSQLDLLVLSLIPLMLAAFFALCGRAISSSSRVAEWPASGFTVARQTLDHYGCGDLPVEPILGGGEEHLDRRLGILRLGADIYHGRSAFAAAGATFASVWAVKVAGRRLLGAFDAASVAMIQFGSPAALLAIVIGSVWRMLPLTFSGVVALYIAFCIDVAWLPVRLAVAREASRLILTNPDVGGQTQRSAVRGVWARVWMETAHVAQPLMRFIGGN